jgi:hypothetical protein
MIGSPHVFTKNFHEIESCYLHWQYIRINKHTQFHGKKMVDTEFQNSWKYVSGVLITNHFLGKDKILCRAISCLFPVAWINFSLEHCIKNEDFKYFSKVPLLLAQDYPHEYAILSPFFCSNWRRTVCSHIFLSLCLLKQERKKNR